MEIPDLQNKLADLSGVTMLEGNAIPCTTDDLSNFLKDFHFGPAIQRIAEVASMLCNMDEPIVGLHNGNKLTAEIALSDLAYFALRIIEFSNSRSDRSFSRSDLTIATKMYRGLPEPPGTLLESLLRLQNAQFVYQYPRGYLLARTLLLYGEVWNTTSEAGDVDIELALADITRGLNLEEILILGWYFGKKFEQNKGIFDYDDIIATLPKSRAGEVIAIEKIEAFLNWCSASPQIIRENVFRQMPENFDIELDRFRFNPLIVTPLLGPFATSNSGVYIAPIPSLLFYRVTLGLYYDLKEYFNSQGRAGDFGRAFGHSFENYVLRLLENAHFEGRAEGERSYGSSEQRNPDALLISGGELVLFQDKICALYTDAKRFGDVDATRKDLKKTLGKGVEQLWSFECDIASGRFPELTDLHSEKRQRVIVLHDEITFANSVVRELVFEALEENDRDRVNKGHSRLNIPKDYAFQVVTIAELELLTAIRGLNLFAFLNEKSLEANSTEMSSYLNRKFGDRRNAYLDGVYDAFVLPLVY